MYEKKPENPETSQPQKMNWAKTSYATENQCEIEQTLARNSLYGRRDQELQNIGIVRSRPFSLYQRNTFAILYNSLKQFYLRIKKIFFFENLRKSREAMMNMPIRYLKDIGLTRQDVDALFLGKSRNLANDNIGDRSEAAKNKRAR